jgi:ERCC4-type nuclease
LEPLREYGSTTTRRCMMTVSSPLAGLAFDTSTVRTTLSTRSPARSVRRDTRRGSMRIDTRAGSVDYIAPLARAGVPVSGAKLAAGDVEIIGRGLKGRPTLVGVELKKWGDLLQCLRDGRYADQQKKMRAAYEVRWLLVEGEVEVGKDGVLWWKSGEHWRHDGGHTIQEVTAWLFTQVMCGGTLLWQSPSQSSSVDWLRFLWLWWTAKDYDEHKSHLEWYIPPALGTWISPPTPVQQVARVLPGIGSTLCALLSEEFPTPECMMELDPDRWTRVEGVGKKKLERVREFWRGRTR